MPECKRLDLKVAYWEEVKGKGRCAVVQEPNYGDVYDGMRVILDSKLYTVRSINYVSIGRLCLEVEKVGSQS